MEDPSPISRINQIDSHQLDDECSNMLLGQFSKLFTLFGGDFTLKFQEELRLMLKSLYYYFTTFKGHQTPGNRLENLKFVTPAVDAKGNNFFRTLFFRQRIYFWALLIFVPYIWAKIKNFMRDYGWRDEPTNSFRYRVWKLSSYVDILYKIVELANFLLFIAYGNFKNVVERALNIQMRVNRGNATRIIDLDYMNRILVFDTINNVLQSVLPRLNLAQIIKSISSTVNFMEDPLTGDGLNSRCGICHDSKVVLAYQGQECQHIFCYYCIQSKVQNNAEYACPLCGSLIGKIVPHGIDAGANLPHYTLKGLHTA
mmetsp:Transcript_210/g.225  ORF Transcript_210/g.225 Transcript_210/m.225 type:complete len:313 (-) Transcript_210:404-1342(-)